MFNSILPGGELTPINFFTCLGVAFVLGLVVAITHQKTTKSSSNLLQLSQSCRCSSQWQLCS